MYATENYDGYFLFSYENGKMAKIPLSSYATKTNRKKLSNAYNAASKLVDMFFLEADTDFAAFSSIDKVLVFNIQINLKLLVRGGVLKSKRQCVEQSSSLTGNKLMIQITIGQISAINYLRKKIKKNYNGLF